MCSGGGLILSFVGVWKNVQCSLVTGSKSQNDGNLKNKIFWVIAQAVVSTDAE